MSEVSGHPEILDLVIVGGGLSGLTLAHRVQELDPTRKVTLLEKTSRLGGHLHTEETQGCVVERGAESILRSKPQALRLAQRLGLQEQIIHTRPESRRALIFKNGSLNPIPEGFSLLVPTRVSSLFSTPLLSPKGKLRALWGMTHASLATRMGRTARAASVQQGSIGDESLAGFVRRRFGPELLESLAQPLAGGIYGADPETLSMAATFPRFLFPSSKGAAPTAIPTSANAVASRGRGDASSHVTGSEGAVRYGMFFNFERGSQTLVDALSNAFLGNKRCHATVESLTPPSAPSDGWVVATDRGPLRARCVAFGTSPRAAAPLVASFHPHLSERLQSIPLGSAAAVTCAFASPDVAYPSEASGFVVPASPTEALTACTWTSRKWPGRSPQGVQILRVFLGSYRNPEPFACTEAQLEALALDGLARTMGVQARPLWMRVDRWLDAMPQYTLGHLHRVERIEAQLQRQPGLFLAGNGLHGVGIPDTVRTAEHVAERVVAYLDGSSDSGAQAGAVCATR